MEVRGRATIHSMLLFVTLGLSPLYAYGEEEVRVPISDNFSRVEIAGLVVLAVSGGGVYLMSPVLAEHMGEPLIGDPGPLDLALTEALYRGPEAGLWLGGVPDRFGGAPITYAAMGFYGLEGAFSALRGRSLLGDIHGDHELLAFTEALGGTLLLTHGTKVLVGRERPYYALDRDSSVPIDVDASLSFFSGHASNAFCLGAFVYRDMSDWLVSGPLVNATPSSRILLGRVLPATFLYGAAGIVAASRIVDQKHYLSDVLVGSLVGGVLGNFAYMLHFDAKGHPRSRVNTSGLRIRLAPQPSGLAVIGSF